MTYHKHDQYKAYTVATGTIAKTRQIVMLYDGTIRFLKQASVAIENSKIEDRFNLLVKASEVIIGLQSSIDFENGGDIANILHGFYTNMSQRIISLNFEKDPAVGRQQCEELINELKQMRDVWDNIDRTLSLSGSATPVPQDPPASDQTDKKPSGPEGTITLSA